MQQLWFFKPQYLFPNVMKYNGHLCICYVKLYILQYQMADYIRHNILANKIQMHSPLKMYIIAVEIFKAITAQQRNMNI